MRDTDDLITDLARRAQDKYYGKYRGFVASNKDPDQLGRLRLRIPSVLGTEVTDWALPCLPFGGTAGLGWFMIPEQDAQVWVEFEEGELRRPIWVGTFWQKRGDTPDRRQEDPAHHTPAADAGRPHPPARRRGQQGADPAAPRRRRRAPDR